MQSVTDFIGSDLTSYLTSAAAPAPVEEGGHQLYAPRLNGSPPVAPPNGQPGNMLVVPQPAFLTSKLAAGGHPMQPGHPGHPGGHPGHTNGLAVPGRKYQCKMCPQVSTYRDDFTHQMQVMFSHGGITTKF